jgi:leucyl aminopeptidase
VRKRIDSRRVNIGVIQSQLSSIDADLLVIGLFEDGSLPPELAGAPGATDAKAAFKKLSLLHPESPSRVLVVGLGKRDDFDPERARIAAAIAAHEARRLEAASAAWALPEAGDAEATAAALTTGTILGTYRFDRFLSLNPDSPPPTRLESLSLIGPESVAAEVEAARICAEAQNRARDLQSLPSNVATPSYLAQRAEEIADAHDSVSVEVLGREQMVAKGMGGLVAVSQGGPEEPKLIVLNHTGGGTKDGPLVFVGKGVTFDTGGISIKPSSGMEEMKMDMSGAAAVIESFAAVAELGLEIELLAIVPATENMPSGTAVKPGDIITQYNGKTVEVNNTDAEGRLILADALAYAVELGAERIVDLATLTGAVLTALGSTYAAVISNDDDLAAEVEKAGTTTGELTWRLPLHPEYKELTRGTVADLVNASPKRKAGTIYAGSFLEEFVGDTPWAHVDIAGTAWDVGRAYTGNDASGFGVRLLVAIAEQQSA